MEEFRQTYVHLCKDHHLEIQDCVIDKLKCAEKTPGKGKTILDLSTMGLSPQTCSVLGKVLATDRNFLEYKFADCMLSEDAVKGLAQGFTHNTYCRKLDLKGNNIRGTSVETLGKMLRHNNSLYSLCLEWNALGMLDNSFAVFSDGVGSNTCLKALDLRNNQINHDGAAELAASLKRNTTLRALDLRWNNIGLIGGRAILEMLRSNKTLSRLELAGNNIPSDILKAIETSVSNNADRQLIVDDFQKRTTTLSKHVQHLDKEKSLQLNELMNTIDKQENIMKSTKRVSAHQVGNLQNALEDRKKSFNALAAKLAMTESELTLAEQKNHDCNSIINRLKQDMSEMTASHHADLRHEKEDRANEEMKLLKELSESNDRNIQLQTKVEDLDRKLKQNQEQLYEYKEQITHLQAELTMKGSHYDERIQQEKTRQKDALHDLETYKQKEINRIRQEADDTEKTLRDRLQKMETHRLELEEEISRLKATNMNDKMMNEEQLISSKQRIKAEEEQRHMQLEEKIRVLQISKDELQTHCTQQAALVSELQRKNSNLQLEHETYKRQLEELGQDLAEKSSITMSEVSKVRHEQKEMEMKLDSERKIQAELREKLSHTDQQLSEQLLKYRTMIEEKDRELVILSEKLRSRDLEITRAREEESQRAHLLQSAIMNYVSKTPFSSPSK
ncbi:leucine-rich repeat-containing protein 45 [Patella vulgata]|uniref:leucine-rich repeat-containing protein 45 n=1 Tax=Patella vulgata TaxID=6465 RepID=UPI00217FEE01|nr:leucine-rich repeat-containing protein 45 [Patella vulgata]XP_050392921.1 leucine-rich repeat-containing protein 45 [Patella vulgata]